MELLVEVAADNLAELPAEQEPNDETGDDGRLRGHDERNFGARPRAISPSAAWLAASMRAPCAVM